MIRAQCSPDSRPTVPLNERQLIGTPMARKWTRSSGNAGRLPRPESGDADSVMYRRPTLHPSAGCVTVEAGKCRDHLPGALEDPLVQLALDDRPHDRFLAFGILLVGHLAGPHPSGRAADAGGCCRARTRRSPGPAQRARRGGRWRPAAQARTAPSVHRLRRRDPRRNAGGSCQYRAGTPRSSPRGSAAPRDQAGSPRGGKPARAPAIGAHLHRSRSEDRPDGGRCPLPWAADPRSCIHHASTPRGCSRLPWPSPGKSILVQPGDVPRHLPSADPHSG